MVHNVSEVRYIKINGETYLLLKLEKPNPPKPPNSNVVPLFAKASDRFKKAA